MTFYQISKKLLLFIILNLTFISYSYAMFHPSKTTATAETEPLKGLQLAKSEIRFSLDEYQKQCGIKKLPTKLSIGAGHIIDVNALLPCYRPGGAIEITESMKGGYEFHKHLGWYTISAETEKSFGSDVVGDIRKPETQAVIFPSETWDLVFDESYHPNVISAPGLIKAVLKSLKPGGKFVFYVPINKIGDKYVIGHDAGSFQSKDYLEKHKKLPTEFNEIIAYALDKYAFDSYEEAQKYIEKELKLLGFASVEIYHGPLYNVFRVLMQKDDIAPSDILTYTEKVLKNLVPKISEEIFNAAKKIAANKKDDNPFYKIDPIFEHVIGMDFIVATK